MSLRAFVVRGCGVILTVARQWSYVEVWRRSNLLLQFIWPVAYAEAFTDQYRRVNGIRSDVFGGDCCWPRTSLRCQFADSCRYNTLCYNSQSVCRLTLPIDAIRES